MSKNFISSALLTLFPFWLMGVSIQKVSITPSDDAYVWTGAPSAPQNTIGHKEIVAGQWTWSGFGEGTMRSYIKFNLSNIPSNAKIIDARLVLKSPSTTTSIGGGHQGQNSWRIEEVIGTWSESTITWNNKPATSADSVVYHFIETKSKQQNYETDITAMVHKWLRGVNNGLMLRVDNEKLYTSIIFASKEHSNSSIHPSLEIRYYVVGGQEVSSFVRLSPQNSSDTYAWSTEPNMTNEQRPEIGAASWSWSGGSPGIIRTFIKFDVLKTKVNIEKVWLRLYGIYPNVSTVKDGHSGNNSAVIKRVTKDWTANTLNWTNQPPNDNSKSVSIMPSTSQNEDYCIDITELYGRLMVEGNYGLVLELESESDFRSLMFGSVENSRVDKRPAIEVVYRPWATSIDNIATSSINFYPNPAKSVFYIKEFKTGTYSIMNLHGTEVLAGEFENGSVALPILSSGLYLVNIFDSNNQAYFGKLLISE